MSTTTFPNTTDVPCECCGIPIGKNSAAYNHGKRCLECSGSPVLSSKSRHSPSECAQDKEAVIALYTKVFNDEKVDKVTTLPSGRKMEWFDAVEVIAVLDEQPD